MSSHDPSSANNPAGPDTRRKSRLVVKLRTRQPRRGTPNADPAVHHDHDAADTDERDAARREPDVQPPQLEVSAAAQEKADRLALSGAQGGSKATQGVTQPPGHTIPPPSAHQEFSNGTKILIQACNVTASTKRQRQAHASLVAVSRWTGP